MTRPHPALAVHGALSRGVFAVVVLVSLAVLFAALAVSGRWAGARAGVLGALLVLYAAVSEVVQGVTALERSASVADWVADVVGVLAGLLAWAWAGRRTRA